VSKLSLSSLQPLDDLFVDSMDRDEEVKVSGLGRAAVSHENDAIS
jgi:hypothetical protein